MKIDIEDIKFWMDAVRNSEDRDRTLESFWGGQLLSKRWLIEQIEKQTKSIVNAEVVIFGGWYGVLSTMLFNSDLGIGKIISVDIDPSCKDIALMMNKKYEMQGMFRAVTQDMTDYGYENTPYMVINTSCEHISDSDYTKWLNAVPNSSMVVLQSNNYNELDEHVNCVDNLEQFKNTCGLSTIYFAGELVLPKYKRFMIIGNK